MLLDSDMSAGHEMCSSDRDRFDCVRFARFRGFTAAFSCESVAAI